MAGVQKIGIRGIQDGHMVTSKTDEVQNNGKNQSGHKSCSLAIRQLRIRIKAIRQKFYLGSLHKPNESNKKNLKYLMVTQYDGYG